MAKIKASATWKAAEYLDMPERQAEYVSAALETGDAAGAGWFCADNSDRMAP